MTYGDRPVLTARTTIAESEDPNLRFYFTPRESGQLKVEVKDSRGQQFAKAIDVTPRLSGAFPAAPLGHRPAAIPGLTGAALSPPDRAASRPVPTGARRSRRPRRRGRRLVVLGASFGGISAGLAVRRLVPDAEIVLLERAPLFVFAAGRAPVRVRPELVRRASRGPYASLGRHGLDVVHATVTALDRDRREVVTAQGRVAYDWLLIATGLRLASEEIPGLPDEPGQVNLCPYDMDASLLELRRRIGPSGVGTS